MARALPDYLAAAVGVVEGQIGDVPGRSVRRRRGSSRRMVSWLAAGQPARHTCRSAALDSPPVPPNPNRPPPAASAACRQKAEWRCRRIYCPARYSSSWKGGSCLAVVVPDDLFSELISVFRRHHRCVVGRQMPEERGVRTIEAKLYRVAIKFAHALHAVGELQAGRNGNAPPLTLCHGCWRDRKCARR